MKTLRNIIVLISAVVMLVTTSCKRKNEDPIPVITNNNTNNNNNNTNTTDTTSKNYLRPFAVEQIVCVNTNLSKVMPFHCKSLVISDTTFDIVSVSSSNNYLYDLKITTTGVSFGYDTTQTINVESNLIITYKTTNIVGKQNTLVMTIPVLIKNGKVAVQEEAPRFSMSGTKQYFSKKDVNVKYIIEGFFVNKQNRHSYVSSISVSKPELFNIYFDSTASTIVISFANGIITYEAPIVTMTVSDGKLSSTETRSTLTNFSTAGADGYIIVKPYLDKQIKQIKMTVQGTVSTIYNQTDLNDNISWGSKNYDVNTATPQLSEYAFNFGSTNNTYTFETGKKLLIYQGGFSDQNPKECTVSSTNTGWKYVDGDTGNILEFIY